jgi:death on curing protein
MPRARCSTTIARPSRSSASTKPRSRTQERDWPTLPIPFFAFREIYEELCREDWQEIGDLPPFELVDGALILSALAAPFASSGGQDLHPSVPAKAAVLFRSLVKNHGLRDGNKRLAVTTMTVFLLANGWLPGYTNVQLYRYALRVAGTKGAYSVTGIDRWVRRNATLMPDGDLAMLRRQHIELDTPHLIEVAFTPVLIERGALREAKGLPPR